MPTDERVARSVALEQAYVHDVYEQFSDNPKSRPWPRVQQFLGSLEPGSIICDVGCGNGKYLNVNTSIFNIGGDKCMRLSEVAREKENEVIVLDNLALPYRDESLDAVLSIAVVHHLATTERRICALRELARVLRIGGRLIISVWAMEQTHRKFESQDVLVPWHRPQQLSTPSLELTSTTTTSEEDGLPPYHAYTQTSDSDSNKSGTSKSVVRKRNRSRHKFRSIDPGRNSSPSSSSLSSPNETCYSFVRRAIQKLAGGKRVGMHRPWFLDSWNACAKEPSSKRYDPDGCECCECDNIQDIPIELRRIDDEEMPQRRQTFPSSQIINDLYANLKSRSMTNIKTVENNNIVRSKSGVPSVEIVNSIKETVVEVKPSTKKLTKPRLVKQKHSICDEDAEEDLDKPTDMKTLVTNLPDFRIFHGRYHRKNVFKQRSFNEELMSTDRLREKERVRQNIQKQTSLNEDLIYQRHAFDSFRDSFFSVSTTKRFQLIKTGFTNKIKNSTTNIEKVTGQSLKNGFVRMFQNWKSSDLMSPTSGEEEVAVKKADGEEKKEIATAESGERRHSKEDGSDSSKDSSLQSDTSVDSEDSFASVIFVPKSDPMSPVPLSPGPTSPRLKASSVPNSPRIKQSSCPTSPRIKQIPLSVYPLTKQLSSPKPSTTVSKPETVSPIIAKTKLETDPIIIDGSKKHDNNNKNGAETLAQRYYVPQIPKFKKNSLNSKITVKTPTSGDKICDNRNERLKKIRELLNQKPGFGLRSSQSNFPLVRHASISNGKVESVARPLPKLLSLELFNPETDDKDSDSSAVSSPDSIDSVVSINKKSNQTSDKFTFQAKDAVKEAKKNNGEIKVKSMNLLEAAADVANSLDEAVDKVIRSSPRARKRQLKTGEVISVMQRQYSTDTTPLLGGDLEAEPSWNDECHKHLTDFADQLSEKLLKEIDHYQEKIQQRNINLDPTSIDDPYIHRLSEELEDLSKLSAEIQKQNEYLAKLSASDTLLNGLCLKCKKIDCKCNNNNNNNNKKKEARNRTHCDPMKQNKNGSKHEGVDLKKKVPPSDVTSKTCGTVDTLPENSVNTPNNKCEPAIGDVDSKCKFPLGKNSIIKMGTSTDSCDSEKGSNTNSMMSSVAASINFSHSIESSDGLSDRYSSDSHKDSNSISRYSDCGSTASLASCPEWKTIQSKLTEGSSSNSIRERSCEKATKNEYLQMKEKSSLNASLSDTSQESLPSDNIGGEITYHRYYHVFREGELDQLIEKYVENLHIISSYYDHASWCVVAEKVQVWTI